MFTIVNRPQPALKELIEYVREGDTVIVQSMDRLARNLDDLRKIVKGLTATGVEVHFVKESLQFKKDDTTAMSNLLLSIMGAFAEFERALIRERQMEGIAIAKAKGAYKGRKPSMTDSKVAEIKERLANGEKKAHAAKEMGISRETLYKYIS